MELVREAARPSTRAAAVVAVVAAFAALAGLVVAGTLNRLDQYAKHELKIRYYLRYVDDLVLLHEDPGRLEVWEKAIESFADTRLRLKLHRQRRRLEPVSNGCDLPSMSTTAFPTKRFRCLTLFDWRNQPT